ncbi:putative membrane protein YdfJ with MMPL/SSD domain [Rhodococcus sp. 27YEA15]|uniref:hypothetical protein n=1 Tax=Rhodococcus sp. 27YEA15 TaxID=3156259 RepID=UPI003C7B58AD
MSDDDFYLDYETSKKLRDACDKLISSYKSQMQKLKDLEIGNAFGTLQSGKDMATKFTDKAFADTDSLKSALESHIKVVTEMRDYFVECIRYYSQVDKANAAHFDQAYEL